MSLLRGLRKAKSLRTGQIFSRKFVYPSKDSFLVSPPDLTFSFLCILCYNLHMRLIEVIPIKRAVGIETLSYFTTLDIKPGALVTVSVRKKKVYALVIDVREAVSAKSEVKGADFEMKKVEQIETNDFLSEAFMRAAKRTADFSASQIGATLFSILPTSLLTELQTLKFPKPAGIKKKESADINSFSTPTTSLAEKYIIQGDSEDRFSSYRSTIRQSFAKKTSVALIVPTTEDASYLKTILEKGIEDFTVTLHSSLGKKAMTESINKICTENHPLLVICTAPYLLLARPDMSTIILERAHSRHYKTQYRPYTDLRVFTEYFAEENGNTLFISDAVLPIEHLYRHKEGELHAGEPTKWRMLTTAHVEVTDMTADKKEFRIFGESMNALIKKSKEQNERMIILVGRKGLSPQTLCGDCQKSVLCHKCGAPVVLYPSPNNPEKTFFMCHHCGERRSSSEVCAYCGSWNLKTVGIGIDLVQKNLKEMYPDVTVFKLDRESCPKESKAKEVADNFMKSPGTILLCTEMALRFIHEKIENVGIVSMDSLLSMPDFRAQERLFYTILTLRSQASHGMVIQTRQASLPVFEYSSKGNILEFYRAEIEARKATGFPPFSTLIKVTIKGKKNEIVEEMKVIQDILAPENVDVFPAFTNSLDGNFVLHGLLKIPKEKWEGKNGESSSENTRALLLQKLKSLPQSSEIRVDPESLL